MNIYKHIKSSDSIRNYPYFSKFVKYKAHHSKEKEKSYAVQREGDFIGKIMIISPCDFEVKLIYCGNILWRSESNSENNTFLIFDQDFPILRRCLNYGQAFIDIHFDAPSDIELYVEHIYVNPKTYKEYIDNNNSFVFTKKLQYNYVGNNIYLGKICGKKIKNIKFKFDENTSFKLKSRDSDIISYDEIIVSELKENDTIKITLNSVFKDLWIVFDFDVNLEITATEEVVFMFEEGTFQLSSHWVSPETCNLEGMICVKDLRW